MTETSPSAFVRPGKVAFLVISGLLVYLVAVVIWVPAGWVWAQVAPKVTLPPQIVVEQVAGSLWSGAARLSVERRPVRVTWSLSWPDLADLRLPLDVTVESRHSRIAGDVSLRWPQAADISLRGQVHVPEFEDMIRASGGALLAGDIHIDRLQLAVNDSGIQSARGIGRWPGGHVSWPMGDQRQSARFPPMQATLSDRPDGVLLVISEEGVPDPAAEATLSFGGMMDIRVYRRMIDLAGQNWSSAAAPGDLVFQVRQSLVQGGR